MKEVKANPRFVILTSFKNHKTGKAEKVPILNMDGHIDIAHQMGLVSLTADIIDEWKQEIPAGVDEENNPRVEIVWWVRVKATAVVCGEHGSITATGFSTVSDRDRFVKTPENLLAVAETRAEKRALARACGITEATYDPESKVAHREDVDLPIVHPGDDDEPEIPQEVRKKPNITPPLSHVVSHPPAKVPDDSGMQGFGF
jgi:hypothetical protein